MSPPRVCLVSFTDPAGVEHSVEVAASSLYEAAVVALADFRRDPLVEVEPAPATRLTVAVKAPTTNHEVSVQTVTAWLESNGKSPSEQLLKRRLRELLAQRGKGADRPTRN